MTDPQKIEEENRKIRYLRIIVELNLNLIASGSLTRKEALETIEEVKKCALSLFPGKGDVFDLIYRPRFLRIIDEVYSKN